MVVICFLRTLCRWYGRLRSRLRTKFGTMVFNAVLNVPAFFPIPRLSGWSLGSSLRTMGLRTKLEALLLYSPTLNSRQNKCTVLVWCAGYFFQVWWSYHSAFTFTDIDVLILSNFSTLCSSLPSDRASRTAISGHVALSVNQSEVKLIELLDKRAPNLDRF